jgi:hypothetical protein
MRELLLFSFLQQMSRNSKSEGSCQNISYARDYLNKNARNKNALWSYKFQISIPAANYNTDQMMKGLGFRVWGLF